jgi:hypothetical protein
MKSLSGRIHAKTARWRQLNAKVSRLLAGFITNPARGCHDRDTKGSYHVIDANTHKEQLSDGDPPESFERFGAKLKKIKL